MGPKRTQYEECRKALNAFDLVYQMCKGGVNSTHTSVKEKLENDFIAVQGDVVDARRRFERARSRYTDIHKLLNDTLFDEQEKTELRALWAKAGAELNIAEQEWNDI